MSCVNKCESGVLYKVHKKTKHNYVFRCDCAYGERHKFPAWRGVNAVEFESEKIEIPHSAHVKESKTLNEEW